MDGDGDNDIVDLRNLRQSGRGAGPRLFLLGRGEGRSTALWGGLCRLRLRRQLSGPAQATARTGGGCGAGRGHWPQNALALVAKMDRRTW